MRPNSVFLLVALLLLSSCGRNMYDQAKYEPLEASAMFTDGASAQLPVENTIPRTIGNGDNFIHNPEYYSGLGESGFVSEVPFELSEALLLRGQERYNIYCAPCHNYSGNGEGMIVQKGFPQPTSFHAERLRIQPAGYFVHAMSNGFGQMASYASRVPPEDRWAIAAYIKTLQYSQYALLEDAEAICEDIPHEESESHASEGGDH